MRAVIFVNGTILDYTQLARWLRPDDYLIAADGGARHCAALGILPAVLVGDLDSITPELLAEYEQAGVAIERHPPRKDETDLELAVRRAVADGATEILLLGALGDGWTRPSPICCSRPARNGPCRFCWPMGDSWRGWCAGAKA